MNGVRPVPFNHRKRELGITLIELMVVVVVVANHATNAVPRYSHYMLRTHRTDGRAHLLRVQVAQEKFFLQNNTYTTNLTAAPPAGLGMALGAGGVTPDGHYLITVAPRAPGIGTSYAATATATGGQAQDVAACRVLTINDQGAKTPNEASGCWR